MTEIIIAIATAIITGFGGWLAYFLKRIKDCTEKAEDNRIQNALLILKSLHAIGELCHANATAIKQGHCNGEIDKAKKEFESVEKELRAFLLEQAVNKVNKT